MKLFKPVEYVYHEIKEPIDTEELRRQCQEANAQIWLRAMEQQRKDLESVEAPRIPTSIVDLLEGLTEELKK